MSAALEADEIDQGTSGSAIAATAQGSGDIALTITGDTLTTGSSDAQDAAQLGSTGTGNLCLDAMQNTATAAGSGADGLSLTQSGSSTFGIVGYPGGSVAALLEMDNQSNLSGGLGGLGVDAVGSFQACDGAAT